MARVFIIRLVILYTFIYNIPQRIYTQFLAHVYSVPSLVPILLIFSRCIRTRGLLANRLAGLLRLAVSPASLRGWRRRRLTPSPYISHYIFPTYPLLRRSPCSRRIKTHHYCDDHGAVSNFIIDLLLFNTKTIKYAEQVKTGSSYTELK